MVAYYNEFEKNAAQWLRNLIADGKIPEGYVDERPIQEVQPADIARYAQCHFFAGIGGWPLALDLAGWPRDRTVWTGSCPCQPYSAAGKGKGDADPRNLWPDFFRLIRECRPDVVFGEQVAAAIGHGWLDRVSTDLEREDYSCGAVVLGAHSVGAPHIRQRLWWVANSAKHGCERVQHGSSAQIQKDWPSQALGAWNSPGSPFKNWRKLLGEPAIRRVDDGVSSTVDIRPRLHAYGNAIVPQVAAEFIRAFMECE